MRIAVLDDYQGLAVEMADWSRLEAQVDFFSDPIPRPELTERLAGYEVLVLMRERTRFDAAVLRELPDLRFVVTTGMRNASLDVAYLSERGIPVSGTGASSGGASGGVSSTTEVAWALILALLKRVGEEDRAMRHGLWQTGLPTGLAGKTLGLLGLGRLGTEMLAPARAFGMEAVAWSTHLTPEAAAEKGVRYVEKDVLFATADVLSVHLVLSERTTGLIGAPELALMKRSAVLVNTSRGPIVDRDAVIAALREDRLAGAGLDVYDTEPLPGDDPILSAPNTVLLPHLGYATHENLAGMYQQAVEDIAAFAAGQPIRLIEP